LFRSVPHRSGSIETEIPCLCESASSYIGNGRSRSLETNRFVPQDHRTRSVSARCRRHKPKALPYLRRPSVAASRSRFPPSQGAPLLRDVPASPRLLEGALSTPPQTG